MSAAAGGGAPTVALAAARPFDALAGWAAIDFISDLHLSPAMPRTFAAWADHLRHTTADAVFGKVVSGQDVVDKIAGVPTASKGGHGDVPVQDVAIRTATLVA